GPSGWGVQMVDAVTHEPQGTTLLFTGPGGAAVSYPQAANPVVDEVDHVLFVPVSWALTFGARASGILIVDGRSRTIRNADAPIIPTVGTAPDVQIDLGKPASLAYDAPSRHLFLEGSTTTT